MIESGWPSEGTSTNEVRSLVRPKHGDIATLRTFLNDRYDQWLLENLKTGKVENGAHTDKIPYPVLDEEYTKARTPIIRLQLLKGGLRLARLLDRVAKGQDVATEKDVAILESVMLENDEVGEHQHEHQHD